MFNTSWRRIERNIAFYYVVMLTVSVFTLMVCCGNAYAEVNSKTLESVAIPTGISEGVAQIKTGQNPVYIYGNLADSDVICVANSDSGTVSVLNTTTNTMMKNILVGLTPRFIYGDGYRIYVANSGSDSVSAIDPHSLNVTNIPVGKGPQFIYGDFLSDRIYVANVGDNSASVINKTDNRHLYDIPVGHDPVYIFGDKSHIDTIYVANSGGQDISVGSDMPFITGGGISLINIKTDKVVAGVTFHKSPFIGGSVICNTNSRGLEAPMNRLIYVSSGTSCIAKPSKGFEFSSWTEVSSDNSTRTITATSGSPWTALLDTFNLKPIDPAANLTLNRFGNFTAYFRVLPAPLPAEYWASLFTVVATAIVGSLLIPAVTGWTKSKRQTSRLNSFHKQMALAYKDNRPDEKDIPTLNSLHKNISDSYAAGKINNEQYTSLKNEVSMAFQEILKKKIESIPEQNLESLNNTRNYIIDTYNNGKLSNDQYTHLKDEISIAYEEIFKRKIANREDDLQRIQEDISDAYSKSKLTKLHYDLLIEKISKTTEQKQY